MSGAKFTPGEWEVMGANNYDGFSIAPKSTLPTLASVERCGSNITVECFNFPGETKANAHLIASAPRLYHALEELAIHAEHWCPPDSEIVAEAKAALVQARGEHD